ncbi:hypothetical protein N656DRAFT_644140 [Canariomyces notabilis]|uniref:Uncharacterized protein n=1 Tax=Canariomyces notabilis TaxID=2074819 RepID=A0AAN6TEU9_9PEZI|nr:hypothetical protein N656DRAFT_644140 [Canariomyces arenarius]
MQPGVLLAYMSTIANALLAIAFAEAVVIGYWARALRGVPLSNLHYNWSGGTGMKEALIALSRGRAVFVSTVCLLVAITSLLRGPLMQRSSHVRTETILNTGNITLRLGHNVDPDAAGYTEDRGRSVFSF